MSKIDKTYFERRLIAVPNQNRTWIDENLQDYIDLHELNYFDNVFGYEMRVQYLEGLEGANPDQKWLDLRDGAEFIDCNGRKQKWKGFLNSLKESSIAYYVYFYLVREGNILLTGTGTTKSKTENSDRVDGLVKLVDAWNYMVDHNNTLHAFIKANDSDYDTYYPTNKLTEKLNYFGI